MGKVTVSRSSYGDNTTEYGVVWTPSQQEKREGAVRASMLLTEREFNDLVKQALAFVGMKLVVQ